MNYNYNQNLYNPYARNFPQPNYGQGQFQQPQQYMQQPIMQQQVQQYETPLQATIYATLKEAEGHIVYPNTKLLFIDKQNGMSYLKTANNEGQSFMRYFKNIEVTADGKPINETKDNDSIKHSNYVTKDELGAFVSLEQYKELLVKVEQLQKQIMGGRTNGNGTATTKGN